MAGALGVCVAAVYYVMTLRVQQTNMKHTLETRQTQLFMQIFQEINSRDSWKEWNELVECSYTDYDDFMRKYDDKVNPENWSKRMRFWYSYSAVGYLLMDGDISIEKVERLVGRAVLMMWIVWGDAILWMREKQGLNRYFSGFEYLYNELVKYYEENPERVPINSEIKPKSASK